MLLDQFNSRLLSCYWISLTAALCLCSVDPTRLLLTFGANVSTGDRLHGNTALHWAVQAKNAVAATVLINNGANIETPNAQVS